MITLIDLPPQGGALQGTGAEVEGEGHECVKLPIGKRYGDEVQDGTFGGLHVLAQQDFGLFGGDAAGELLPFLGFYDMAIANGGIASGADVHGWRETFELLDQIESGLGDVAHGIVKDKLF